MSESLQRAVLILDELSHADGDLAIREIAARTDLSKSAVQRLLQGLVSADLASQDPTTRHYRLGPRTLALGTAFQRRINLRQAAWPIMLRLRDRTGETVGLSVLVGEELMHVEQVESAAQLRRSFELGRPLPLWSGAPSRLFLATMAEDDVRRIATERSTRDYVPADPPTPEQLLTWTRQAREQRWSAAFGETISGVNTLSAAVEGAADTVVGAISITGPSSRLDKVAMDDALPHLLSAAAETSNALGVARPRSARGQGGNT